LRSVFFLPSFFVLSAFGQTSQNAVDPSHISKEAIQAIVRAAMSQTKPTVNVMVLPDNGPMTASSCSVPLVEMKIPKDIDFVIAQAAPPSGFSGNMPVAKGLLACPTGR
jgi:hypothetical protein